MVYIQEIYCQHQRYTCIDSAVAGAVKVLQAEPFILWLPWLQIQPLCKTGQRQTSMLWHSLLSLSM